MASVLGYAHRPSEGDDRPPGDPLAQEVEVFNSGHSGGTLAIASKDLRSGRTLESDALAVGHAASTMKVLRGVEYQKGYDTGLNYVTRAHDLMLVMEAVATGRLPLRRPGLPPSSGAITAPREGLTDH